MNLSIGQTPRMELLGKFFFFNFAIVKLPSTKAVQFYNLFSNIWRNTFPSSSPTEPVLVLYTKRREIWGIIMTIIMLILMNDPNTLSTVFSLYIYINPFIPSSNPLMKVLLLFSLNREGNKNTENLRILLVNIVMQGRVPFQGWHPLRGPNS